MKKVSVYVKGNRNSTAYYRIYQYLDNIEHIECLYHTMMSERVHKKYMPISKQVIIVKIFIYIHIYIRIFRDLVIDSLFPPNILIIHRRIISRFMPPSFKILLNIIKWRDTKIIWDFDDQIIESKEISKNSFYFLSKLSSEIIVTHEYLRNLLPTMFREKVHILPTTDGDMYKKYLSENILDQRLLTFNEIVEFVWVGTSSNLVYLHKIIQTLDNAALALREKNGKKMKLRVVCDKSLNVYCKYLVVENVKWTRAIAIESMEHAHIGIMPLEDNIFTRGKGGFKLIQYLSIGLPCIGTHVGFNKNVIHSDCGFLVESNKLDGWINAIIELSSTELWLKYSNNAFNYWKNEFSYEKNLFFWSNLLLEKTHGM